MKKTIKVASFFSGCGGLDLGLEGGFSVHKNSIKNREWVEKKDGNFVNLKKTGFETVFSCDIKASAKATWENYFNKKDVFLLESIVSLVKKAKSGQYKFPDVDLVTGGFPCQDFSVAGKRRGFDSKVSHQNIMDINLPTEESRGMLYYWMREAISVINPKFFIAENVKGLVSMQDAKEIIANDFRNVNGGYLVIEPQVLHAGNYGVPQSRERVFFIGIRKDLLNKEFENRILSKVLDIYPKPTHNIESKDISTARDYLLDLIEPELSSDSSHQKYSKAKWYGRHCQGQTEINIDGLAPTIRSEHHGNIEFRRLSKDNGGKIKNEHNLPQRRLSVRECARIQTFPDDYQFILPNVSASEAYKLVGNAVPPLLAYHIAQNLKSIIDQLENDVALNNKKTSNEIKKINIG
jgi:DNA (cytosine-5)-methyltransferase 1